MKVSVRSLHDGFPKQVHEEYHPKDLDVESVDLTYQEAIMLDGTVEKFQDTLTVRGHLTSRIEHTCARCLKQVEEPLSHPFELIYDVRGKEEVDTLEDIREMLILDRPIRYLCREECHGLCPQCGTDLNEGKCTCGKPQT